MENTQKKARKPKLQLVISILAAVSFILAELYVMINQPADIALIIKIAACVLLAVYFAIDAVIECQNQKEAASKEQYENISRSEKASYMLLRKSLDNILDLLQDTDAQSAGSEEIINAQKALAKISLNKNKENIEMVLAEIARLEKLLSGGFAGGFDSAEEEKQDRLFIELNNLEASLNDRLQGLSDKLSGFQEEIERLADHIAKINTEAISEIFNSRPEAAAAKAAEAKEEEPDFSNLDFGSSSVSEESDDFDSNAFSDMDTLESADSMEEPEAVVEEAPAAPALDLSDPNKMMTPEDIAALLASI